MMEDPSKLLISWIKVIFLTALIVLVTRQYVFEPVEVHGKSMWPTFQEDDKILLAKMSSIENFDLIVFSVSDDTNYLKRVIGIPGDRVEIKDGQLYLNGEAVEEPYVEKSKKATRLSEYPHLTGDFIEVTVPTDYYFVLGDNRLNSVDSRMLGFISSKAIIGEAKLRLAPVENLGVVN